jgi:hypothetical protein
MSVTGTEETAQRLAGLGDRARRAAERAVAEEAASLAADGTLLVEPGESPLEKRLVARRVMEFGTRQKPARPSLLRVLTIGTQALSRRLGAALSGLLT